MSTATPQAFYINVYTSLPKKVVPEHDIYDSSNNWRWVHCLSIPLDTPALQFSHKPYKWIRYAIGVVVGAEGVLSSSSNSLIVINNNAVLPSESINLYYHTSTEERQRMFPIDPDIARTRATSSVHTDWRDGFRDGVARRDRRSCFITGAEEIVCDAVHLLSYSKDDTYISTYTQCRSRNPTGDDIVHDIDDIRNGLFINRIAHTLLGTTFAFLMTPNFALDTSDIDPDATPTEMRCTPHVFQRDLSSSTMQCLRPRSPLRPFHSTANHPPAILFDAVYATAVLHHFGTQTLRTDITAAWVDTFYPGGVKDAIKEAAHADSKAITDQRTAHMKMKENQAQEREARHEACSLPDAFDMLMILPYVLVPPNELQTVMREAKERAAAVEQRRVQEKVSAWARQITAE